MKTLRAFLLMMVLIAAPTAFISCEEEEDPVEVTDDCLAELEGLSNILVEKSNTFSANPTSSNCNALRTAALNLMNHATSCGYGYLYEEQTDFWLSYDCSDFD